MKHFIGYILLFAVFLTGCSNLCFEENTGAKYKHKVTFLKVIDGDTFKVFDQGKINFIRLAEIDCFEIRDGKRLRAQAKNRINTKKALKIGIEAEIKLANLLMYSNYLDVLPLKTDKYGRIVAYVYAKNSQDKVVNVNQYMAIYGMCLAFPDKSYYKGKKSLEIKEKEK